MNNITAFCSESCACSRFLAPTITFTASAIAVALSLIYTSKYLAIPSGCGCLASFYMCDVINDLRNRKNMEKQITHLRAEVTRLETANNALAQNIVVLNGEVARFSQANAQLEQSLGVLRGELVQLSGTNQSLDENVRKLKSENEDLSRIKTHLETETASLQSLNLDLTNNFQSTKVQYDEQLKRLKALNASLEGMRDNSSSSFNGLVASLTAQIKAFEEENGKLKLEMEATSQTAVLLEGVLKRLSEWSHDATKVKLIKEIDQLSEVHAKISQDVGAARAQVEHFQRENEKLKKINESLVQQIAEFEKQNAIHGQHNLKLGEIAEAFQERKAS